MRYAILSLAVVAILVAACSGRGNSGDKGNDQGSTQGETSNQQSSDAGGDQSAGQGGSGNYQVCNRSQWPIHVALAYQDSGSGKYISRGWIDLPSGGCKPVLQNAALTHNTYYAYAYISNDKTTNMPEWHGYDYFCLSWNSPFEIDTAKENANCTRTETQNEDWVGFFAVDATQNGGTETIQYGGGE